MLIGCSGWNYGDDWKKGGWVGSFYPDTKTKRRQPTMPLLSPSWSEISILSASNHLVAINVALAVPMPFATPSPSIPSPIMTPRTGPGNTITAKYCVFITPAIMPVTPLAANNPATRNDLCFHNTTKANVASTMAPMPGHGASPARSAPPLIITVRNTTSVAAASPTDNTFFRFVMLSSSHFFAKIRFDMWSV
ncbi:MAG TPA: hypothetical protein VKA09_03360 [Nitrososphaeraceae archaeon]|nr:hypothetical protein [Nitrososphaeraceae archaeon]